MAQSVIPPTPAPLPLPPAPPPPPTEVDPAVVQARDAAKKRAAGLQGYASTIATSPLGLATPPSTTAGGKTQLGA